MTLSINQKYSPIEYTDEKITLLKNTVCKGASNEELQLFLHVCKRTGLDPFRNQIYAIKRQEKMTIQMGIDGFRLIAERTEKYAPGKEPTYAYDVQGNILSATAYIKKQTFDGTWHEVSATAFWAEYVQQFWNSKEGKNIVSKFWLQMPHNQLAKCAEALALRKAFPADFSGIYTTEEMGQADNTYADVEIKEIAEKKVLKKKSDLSDAEIEEYLQKWGDLKEKMRNYIAFVKEIKKTKSLREVVELLEQDESRTKTAFNSWLEKNKAA